MNAGKHEHSISDLAMEPLALIKRKPSHLRSQPSQNISAHRQKDERGIKGEDQTSTSRQPYRESQGIETS